MSEPQQQSPFDQYWQEVEAEANAFAEQKAAEVQAPAPAHFVDANPTRFTASQRVHTTILHAGLTMAHDLFIQSAFRGLGYKVEAMEVPDNRALQFGREYGNRGQCNPTYFTVGNLVKKLKAMEASGIPRADIIKNYVFATAGSCGPCRFGTYVTEYRKALRDAGFDGFRVLLFQQAGGLKQATGEDMGLEINPTFFLTMTRAVLIGDVLNILAYRIRPFERQAGATDAAIARAKERIASAFEARKGLAKALRTTRRELAAIAVDRTQIKPRVAIIGEFWAMTTEGDGNYKMQRFLEGEGAEVDVQPVVNWGLYLLWAARYDLERRASLRGVDTHARDGGSKFALDGINVAKKRWSLRAAEAFMRGLFYYYARSLGLKDYHLPDMNHLAEISHTLYDNNLRGGEGHLEVGKLLYNVIHNKVSMTLSIKPFGCMPSSAVSDGVQSLVTELHPSAVFLPIETNGDGAVNVYSRVQMQLHKAREAARAELAEVLARHGASEDAWRAQVAANAKYHSALYRSSHAGSTAAADLAADALTSPLAKWRRRWQAQRQRATTLLSAKAAAGRAAESLRRPAADPVRIVQPSTSV